MIPNIHSDLGLAQPSSMGQSSYNSMNPYDLVLSSHHNGLQRHECELIVIQQPELGRSYVGEDKNRKPIDPPPVVQLKIRRDVDPEQSYLQSPYFFVTCNLIQPPGVRAPLPSSTSLMGTVVSSLHRLKDSGNKEGAFFVFGDLSVRLEGQFALQFNLYEMRENLAAHVRSIVSQKFTVQGPKLFPGLAESTHLTRSFSEQGVRLRVRKEPRLLLRKNGPSDAKYVPRKNKRSQQMQEEESKEVFGSPESSRQNQAEQQGYLQPLVEGPHAQQMEFGGSYPTSQQSTGSYGSYSQEHLAKRPRTGSEHSQLSYHSQQSAFTQPAQQLASFAQQRPAPMSYASFPPPSPQGMYAGQPYNFSPTTYRGAYFPPPFNSQQGIESPRYEQPQQAHYSPQPQSQYQHLPGYGGQPSPSLQHYGMVDDSSRQSGMDETEMRHLQYGRMTSGAAFGAIMGNQGDRRSSFGFPLQHGFPQLGQNVSAGGMTRSPSIPITTVPGPMDNIYQ